MGAAQVGAYVREFESALPRLQADLGGAQIRVAEALLPLQPQLLKLIDASYLRGEDVLSPVFAAAATEGGKAKQVPGAVEPLLPLLPELKQWVVYGFLLCPEELATPGAPELLLTVLSTMYVLPVLGDDRLWPHAEFDAKPQVVAGWLKSKEAVKRFQATVKESRVAAFRTAGGAHLGARTALCTKLAHLESFLGDSPHLLASRMPRLLATLRLAQVRDTPTPTLSEP